MYREGNLQTPLSQGDILDACPLLTWDESLIGDLPQAKEFVARVVVLTQACDLAQSKAKRAVVALVHDAKTLIDAGILNATTIRDQIRLHRVFGWYFLPAGETMDESIVDLRDMHTIPRALLDSLIQQGKRLCSIETPYREHLAQHFAITYSRIGLPSPYETSP